MLDESFEKVYRKFKMHFYQKVFEKWQGREVTLTTMETFCMEVIHAMNKPTINQFAKVANLSSPNAAYKVANLVKKGYLEKQQSDDDKRVFYLVPTQKYIDYYNISYHYVQEVMSRMEGRFSKEEIETFEKILVVMNDELMNDANF